MSVRPIDLDERGSAGLRRGAPPTATVGDQLVAVAGADRRHGAGRPTDYAFASFAYGTKVKARPASCARAAPLRAWIGCTRQAGKDQGQRGPRRRRTEQQPADRPRCDHQPQRDVQEGEARHRGRHPEHLHGRLGGARAAGPAGALRPSLTIDALTTTATAWATTDGKLHAATDSSVARHHPRGAAHRYAARRAARPAARARQRPGATTLDQVIDLLQRTAAPSRSPAWASWSPATRAPRSAPRQAVALALSLRVTLYGARRRGRQRRRLDTEDRPQLRQDHRATCHTRVMGGSGWAPTPTWSAATAHIGDIVPKQLPCQGTDGRHAHQGRWPRPRSPASALAGSGARRTAGSPASAAARAWTEGSVAHVSARVRRPDADHRRRRRQGQPGDRPAAVGMVRRDTEGTSPGVLTLRGPVLHAARLRRRLPELPPSSPR